MKAKRSRFDRLVARYYPSVYSFAARLTDDPREAVALTHEGFNRARTRADPVSRRNLNLLKCLPSKFLEESRKINSQTGQHDMNATMSSDAVRLELRDNGKGFISDNANGDGIGLIGMKERAEQIGATLAITSEPGAGTTIIAVSPSNSR